MRAPPAFLERLLVRAGRHTRVGACAVEDLRREHAAWQDAHGTLGADVRYARAAVPLAFRLWLEGRRASSRASSSAGWPDSLGRDVRFGVRSLLRTPGFTATAGVTLAVGIGATTAIFAVVYAVLLEPLPYPDAHELVAIEVNTGGEGWHGSSIPEFFDYEEQIEALESVAAFTVGDITMGDTLAPVRVRAVFASAALLPTLGVEPMLGRFFASEEETSSNNRYVVLSHLLWTQAYGADPDLIGMTIPQSGVEYQVLGVMPPGYAFPDEDVRAWFPYGMDRTGPAPPRMNHVLSVIGRLRDGQTIDRAAAELATYTARAREQYPEIYSERGFRGRIRSLHERVVGDVRVPIVVLQAAVALVLLIACVNVANLFLSRADTRYRELAVRVALGASRSRLVRQLTIESLELAALGGLAGVALAWLALRALIGLAPSSIPRLDGAGLGLTPMLLALSITTCAGLAFGTLPALLTTRSVTDGGLARGGRGLVARRTSRRMRRGLVASQIALASIVAVAAGLMLRTLQNLRGVDLGFDPDNVVTMAISPAFARYGPPEQRIAFWDQTTTRLAQVPGVRAVGALSALPLSGLFSNLSIRVEGRVTTSIGDAPDAYVQRVTPGLFEALGVRLVRGRTFTAADRADAEPVVVVSQSFAGRFWPGEDPIGKTMRVFADGYPWLRVIGVVADVPIDRLDAGPLPMWYVPVAQGEFSYGTPLQLLVGMRIDGPPDAVLAAVRTAVREIDPTAPISRIRLMEDVVDASIAGRTFTFDLLRAFVVVALFLGCVGVYGVTALSVAERRGEIGLRKALGADRRSILRLVARENVATVASGAGVGLAAALLATRVMESLLFGVRRADLPTLLVTLGLVAATGVAASVLPTLRALRIEPLATLREDG